MSEQKFKTTEELGKLSAVELEAYRTLLSQERSRVDKMFSHCIKEVTRHLEQKLAEANAAKKLEKATPAEREVMRKLLGAKSVPSGETVGKPES